MKMKYLLYIPLLFVCVFVPFGQSFTETYVYNTEPCIRWGSWQVGQRRSAGNQLSTSFITNSETTCCVNVSVKYCANQPSSYVEAISDFDFEITMNNGFEVERSVESTTGPDPSLLDPTTTFSVEAKLKGKPDTERLPCSQNGRRNTPMVVTVTFKGYYASDKKKQNPVTLTKKWQQLGIDLIRQEYVDMTPSGTRAELPVPERVFFKLTLSSNGNDRWNTGDYGHMVDNGLKDKKAAWLAEVNKYRKSKSLSEFTDEQFRVTCGYRNPYHNRFHAGASFHSRHCYGDALDVRTVNVNGVNGVEQLKHDPEKKIDSKPMTKAYAKSKSDDAVLMELLAERAGAFFTLSWEEYNTHTHADWTLRQSDGGNWPPRAGTVYSPPCEHSQESSSPTSSSSTTTPTTSSPQPSTPETAMHPCQLHATTVSGNHSRITPPCGDSGHATYACQISSDHRTTISGWSGTFYECQPHTTYPCGHTDPTANAAYHDPHERCTHTNANGQRCTVRNFYDCDQHTHVYPPPTISCGRSGCSQTVSSANQHSATCASGHSYWSCNPSDVNSHITRTCRYSACGKSWQKCMTGGTTPICDVPWRKRNGLKCWQQ